MKCCVLIDSGLIGEDEVIELNRNSQSLDIHYSSMESSNFLPPEVVIVLIEFIKNIGYSSSYDILKHLLSKIISLVISKCEDNTQFRFEIACNDKKISLQGNITLTEQQIDKLINTATETLLSKCNEEDK